MDAEIQQEHVEHDMVEIPAVSNNDLDFQVHIQQAPEPKEVQGKTDLQKFQERNLEEAQQIEKPHQAEIRANQECLMQMFHMIFKILGLALYSVKKPQIDSFFVLSTMINSTFAFIIVVLMDAFDFWTVKNITGRQLCEIIVNRKLVGLRWWSEIRDDGQEVWLYESMDVMYNPDECNSNVFWFVQSVCTLLWFVLTIVYLIGLQLFWVFADHQYFVQSLLGFIGLILTGLNFVGFYKCRGEHQKKARELVGRLGMKAIQRSM